MSEPVSDPPAPSSFPARPLLGVSISVWRDGRVLLVRRGKAPGRGLWSPVGGKVEFGETLAEAAEREVLEETAVTCRLQPMSAIREMLLRDREGVLTGHVVLAVFGAVWLAGEAVAGDDAEAVAWVDPAEFPNYRMLEGVEPYILATRPEAGGTAV